MSLKLLDVDAQTLLDLRSFKARSKFPSGMGVYLLVATFCCWSETILKGDNRLENSIISRRAPISWFLSRLANLSLSR